MIYTKKLEDGYIMKSRTKNLLTKEQITKLVKVNFGDSCEVGTITELKGGMFNSAYLIERKREKDTIVLKVSVKPHTPLLTYEKEPMPTEVAVNKLIVEKTSIPVPHILVHDFSKKVIDCNYFFMTAMVGEPMNKAKIGKANKEKLKKELAGYFAQLHQIEGDYFGYFTNNAKLQFSSWKDAFSHMFEMILTDGRNHQIKLPYERYEKVLQNNACYLERIVTPSLVDYDLWPGNIFVKKIGEEYCIEGILDFERAFWGDPIADFPSSFLMVDDIQKEKMFLDEYLRKSKNKKEFTKEDNIRFLLYRLYIYTIMAVETYRYDFLYSKFQLSFSKNIALKCLKELELLHLR